MKCSQFPLLAAPVLLLASLGAASAAIVVQDTYTDGGNTNGTDALDVAWSSGSVLSTPAGPGTGNYLQISSGGTTPGTGFGQVTGALPSNPLLNLVVGQTMTVTFNFSYAVDPGNDPDGFRFGILGASGTRVGSGVVLGTGTSTGIDLRYDSLDGGSSFGGSTPGDNVGYPGQTKVAMTTGLTVNAIYAMSLTVTRNLNSLTIESTANGGSSSTTVADTDPGFYTDYSAGQILVRAGGPVANMNIDDVTIDVVPEPTTAALACLSLLALARRRR